MNDEIILFSFNILLSKDVPLMSKRTKRVLFLGPYYMNKTVQYDLL